MALWDKATQTTLSKSLTSSTASKCTSFALPSNGVIQLDFSSVITLVSDAVYKPLCTTTVGLVKADVSTPSSVTDLRDPFYASTLPQCFALAATTVIAYMLVIMLLITPRTFLSGGTVILGRRGFTNGNGGSGGVGIGGRPWLQKVAALTVAVSLTIATVDTFRVAEKQYEAGNPDAKTLQKEVLNSTELKVIRVISDTFLWLAQAQTLIRLFPRHREKVIIKWTAFALILLDLIFSILNNFVFGYNNTRPRTFEDAIPALSYLFQLALGLLYCAWVIYYAITKRTYAFYHQHMRNICLVALLSIIAVVVPVVFFVLDISKPTLAGWGDYVRWVGAAAASVVVWEWVERIEALERNDKKDGVLGREVFDGDEMLEVTPSFDTLANGRRREDGGGANRGTSSGATGPSWPAMSGIASRYRPRQSGMARDDPRTNQNHTRILGRQTESINPTDWPTRPPPTATPISRTDTASAESTVYAIRYHPITEARGPTEDNAVPSLPIRSDSADIDAQREADVANTDFDKDKDRVIETLGDQEILVQRRPNAWESIQRANPFWRKDEDLPREVSAHTTKIVKTPDLDLDSQPNRWDILRRLEDFAALQADRLREKTRATHDLPSLPVTRIPAPQRTRTLQEISEQLLDGEETRPLRSGPATQITREAATGILTATNAGDDPSSPVSRDPYTPAYVDETFITQRGSLSFAAARQRDMDYRRRDGAKLSPSENDQEITPRSSVGRDSPRSNSHHFQASNSASLPVRRIPAPPRQPKSQD